MNSWLCRTFERWHLEIVHTVCELCNLGVKGLVLLFSGFGEESKTKALRVEVITHILEKLKLGWIGVITVSKAEC